MKVIAVIGDIVGSSRHPFRDALQDQLAEALERVNQASRPDSIFTISAGDEVEAVYTRGETLLRDLLLIASAIHPTRIRFSIAIGELATKLDPMNPLTADGPAFHVARAGLIELSGSTETLRIGAEPGLDVSLENDAVRLLALHVHHWRQNRWAVFRELSDGAAIVEISRKLEITPVAVYKNMRAGAIDLIIRLADDIGKALTLKLSGGR